jgi:biopolymer transport protein ExbB
MGCILISGASYGFAQEDPQGPVPVQGAEIEALMNEQPPAEPIDPSVPTGIDLLTLISSGGAFMIPIGLMSLLVVALAVERMLTLRKRKILPKMLVEDIQELLHPIEKFNPSHAYDWCVDQPSPAARVVMAMLMRTGQPMADIERAAAETIEREADQFSSPIRWLTLAAAATPLMGLLGTVWGMIVAFHESTTLTADRSRSEQLSEGIYTALVTTLAGLIVAIPAAILALYLENRLAKLFHKLERLAFDVAPALAQFRGRKRMDNDGKLHSFDTPVPPPVDDSGSPAPPARKSTRTGRGSTKRVS